MMQISALRPPIQLALCLILVYRWKPVPSLLLQALLSLGLYTLTSVFIVLPYHLFIYLPFLSPVREVPAPPPGLNTWQTWLAKEPSPPQLLSWLKAASKEHGDQFRGVMRYYGIGGSERLLVTSPTALKELLVTKQYDHFDRPTMARKRIAVQAGNGLIASGGDIHRQQKRKLIPAFGVRAIKDLHPLFWDKANELVAALHEKTDPSGSAVVEILSWTSRAALDVIGVAAWGRDFDAISTPDSAFLTAYSAMFDISGGGQLSNALALAIPMSLVLHIPLPYNKRLQAALRAVRERCAEAVRARKTKLQQAKDGEADKDILSLLIRGGIQDDEALIEQMMTMLAAGHDTSSLSLAWGCYLLCKHPDVQKRLREEVRSKLSLGSQGAENEITPEALEELPYLHAVANEILRLIPAVPVTRRETFRATSLQGYYIPQGGHLVASGWVANRLESEWGRDAEQFVPDRWLAAAEDNSGNDKGDRTDAGRSRGVNNNFAFHSFSHGARSCIGQGFARGELLVSLSALVGSFEMELEDPSHEPVALFGITMSPQDGIRMKLTNVE